MVKTTELLFDDIRSEFRKEWGGIIRKDILDWILAVSQLYDNKHRDYAVLIYRNPQGADPIVFDRLGDMWGADYITKQLFAQIVESLNMDYATLQYTLAELYFSKNIKQDNMEVVCNLMLEYHDTYNFIPKLLYCICTAPLEVANYLDCGFSLEELYNIINLLYENYYTLEQDNIFKNTYCWRLTNSFVFIESQEE